MWHEFDTDDIPSPIETTAPMATSSEATRLQITLDGIDRPDSLEHAWRTLERQNDHSFFQSWGWIGCWLRQLGSECVPRCLTVRAGGEIVGLGVLVFHRGVRHGLVPSKGLYLNETGDARYDQLTVEYNGILGDQRSAESVAREVLAWLADHAGGWDELYLSGIDQATSTQWEPIARERGLNVWVRDRKRSDFVNLDSVRRSGGDYIATLSRNTRYQIRRALKLYEGQGPVSVEAASTPAEALGYFEALKRLHQTYWVGRGQPGSFANPFFEQFHRALIEDRFAEEEVQLLRLAAGDAEIGYLYNFVKDGRVYAYQSGFDYRPDAKLKPGLVSHYLAIEYNMGKSHNIYDFMAGEGQHKQSLSSDSTELTWLVLQRDRPKYRLERALRRAKNRLGR